MFEKQIKIPQPEEIKEMAPMPEGLKKIKAERDALITDVITGKSNRLIVIVGPCSAHEPAPVLDYVERLGRLNERVAEKLVLVPRIYTNKPRTKGVGYKGMFSQPDPAKGEDILKGILTIRRLNVQAIEASGLSAADEMLYPSNYDYVDDLLSYVAVGARSSENQLHRLVASGIDQPVGMKNPTSGDFSVMLNSIHAAHHEHTFLYRDHEVSTSGNPYAHAIIRGSVDKHGTAHANYHYEDLMSLTQEYIDRKLSYPCVICDANHSNSGKKFYEQPRIVAEILHNRTQNKDLHNVVKGVMVESYIEEGNCKIEDHIYGKSITDACLGWADTEKLIHYIAEKC